MSPRLTMKQKLEHQAAYIKQLEKIKEEYDSLKEFIFTHMCSMIPENEEEKLNKIFNNLEVGDYVVCDTSNWENSTFKFLYRIIDKGVNHFAYNDNINNRQVVTRYGFVINKLFIYKKQL